MFIVDEGHMAKLNREITIPLMAHVDSDCRQPLQLLSCKLPINAQTVKLPNLPNAEKSKPGKTNQHFHLTL